MLRIRNNRLVALPLAVLGATLFGSSAPAQRRFASAPASRLNRFAIARELHDRKKQDPQSSSRRQILQQRPTTINASVRHADRRSIIPPNRPWLRQ